MSEILTLKLRPRTLDDMIGQEAIVSSIRNQIASGRIPMAWMFAGESRGGKTTLARILAVALNKPDYMNFGMLTEDDWKEADNYDIIEHNASNINGIDGIRELVARTSFMPMGGRYRVIIVDECQRLTKQAQDCLLKPTEDSVVNIWMFCTTEPDKIIDPLQKRCATARYKMSPLSQQGIYNLLNWALPRIATPPPAVSPEFVQALYESDITAPGVIMSALEKFLSGVSAKEAVIGSDPDVDSKELCRALLHGQWAPIQAFLMKANPEDIRTLRYQILGYMRRVALGSNGSSQWAAQLCVTLAENAPYDDVSHAAWFTGKLHQILTSRPAQSYGNTSQYQQHGYSATA